jgi:hypothetical protein
MGGVRSIPDPGFAGDDGAASARLAAALSTYATDRDRLHSATLAVLQHSRLLVPVVAILGEVEYDEPWLAHDKTSDMATVLMRGRDGRTALLAFTGTEALHRWDPKARPVPVPAAKAAEAARHDGAAAIVVDVAGPVKFVVEEEDLGALADGYTLLDVDGRYGWAKADG